MCSACACCVLSLHHKMFAELVCAKVFAELVCANLLHLLVIAVPHCPWPFVADDSSNTHACTRIPTHTQVQTRSLVPTAFIPPEGDDLPQLEEEGPRQESVNISATASSPEGSQTLECGHGIAIMGSSPSKWKHRISLSVVKKSNAAPH